MTNKSIIENQFRMPLDKRQLEYLETNWNAYYSDPIKYAAVAEIAKRCVLENVKPEQETVQKLIIFATPRKRNWTPVCISIFEGVSYPTDIISRINNALYGNGIPSQNLIVHFLWINKETHEADARWQENWIWNGFLAEEVS